ncbi:hypothetical protein QQ008_12570 [Fulvivirgaceae bacterium BMA10]|uniref:Alpha-galactosidase n=1 Tax=Splendidivirga corallicola TaxID=3051826 RepID=A0ABT8KN96_9BACT|nr:hypothetical protein [Fulvivirgaceae bacterium BMA10]
MNIFFSVNIKLQFLILVTATLVMACSSSPNEFTIENEYLGRKMRIADGKLSTVEINNKISGNKIAIHSDKEFKLRISDGTHTEGTDVELTSDNFSFVAVLKEKDNSLAFSLENKEHGLTVEVHYELDPEDFYTRKYLKIKTDKDVTIERVDVEIVALNDISQPYQIKQIAAQGPAQWRPGLGQPLYTTKSATFWGIEFPAAYNYVEGKQGFCGYQWGREVKAGETYTTYKSVMGVADEATFIQDAFFDYIDRIRIRPLRLQVQYNSWFDFWSGVDKEKFGASVAKVNQKLVKERGVPPLSAYVIDDGWQDVEADWSDKAWKVNQKFESDFAASTSHVQAANSNLGLWMSPGCLFGAQPAAKRYKEQGFETIGNWMSMAGPKYMQLLEDRILELTRNGVTYFKLDGLFGHLNIREFELNGQNYGIPYMPQLVTEGLSPSDSLLNDPKFDELKTYYLVAGTERLMQLFEKQHKVNPDVYVVISNGAYLSPWWLMYIDAVWMINAGDAAGGSNRTQELVYRDGVYYDTWQKEKTQYPIHSVFNHEPKKVKTGESPEKFAEYLWMNLSRGTGFIELYIKTQQLSESDWDVLAEGLKWAHKAFPYFKRAKMHGGNPKKEEVYGYTAWNETGGYISLHNPSGEMKTYTIELNKSFGLSSKELSYIVSSPLKNADELTGKTYGYGDALEISLEPGEVKILDMKPINSN